MKWFGAECPVNEKERLWIEKSSEWLSRQLSLDSNDVKVILPTAEFFPDVYRAEEADVDKLLRRVCAYMKVHRDRLSLELFSDRRHELRHVLPSFESRERGVAGQFSLRQDELIKIRISTDSLSEPMALVATIAHELGHVLLLADARISNDRKDHELLTDLVTVLCGLGIFTANSSFTFRQWRGGFKQGWESKRLGYMTEAMFGYALAWFAFVREESTPTWSTHLRGDARHYFKASLRYLRKAHR
jgi:hypothetical protein